VAPRAVSAPARPPRPASPAPTSERDSLVAIRADLGDCRRCRLADGRTQIVFGVGSPQASLLIAGEAPGYHEDRTGEPFVGRAGMLLNQMLAAIGLSRSQVYICNVIKCRPPNNRDPSPDEIATCSPFLDRQVRSVEPRVILTLGRFAGQVLTGTDLGMQKLRTAVRSYREIPVVATFHPAYLLRNPAAKRDSWADLRQVRALLRSS
jgi:DNA polymerase